MDVPAGLGRRGDTRSPWGRPHGTGSKAPRRGSEAVAPSQTARPHALYGPRITRTKKGHRVPRVAELRRVLGLPERIAVRGFRAAQHGMVDTPAVRASASAGKRSQVSGGARGRGLSSIARENTRIGGSGDGSRRGRVSGVALGWPVNGGCGQDALASVVGWGLAAGARRRALRRRWNGILHLVVVARPRGSSIRRTASQLTHRLEHVYVVDFGNERIQKFMVSGIFVLMLGGVLRRDDGGPMRCTLCFR